MEPSFIFISLGVIGLFVGLWLLETENANSLADAMKEQRQRNDQLDQRLESARDVITTSREEQNRLANQNATLRIEIEDSQKFIGELQAQLADENNEKTWANEVASSAEARIAASNRGVLEAYKMIEDVQRKRDLQDNALGLVNSEKDALTEQLKERNQRNDQLEQQLKLSKKFYADLNLKFRAIEISQDALFGAVLSYFKALAPSAPFAKREAITAYLCHGLRNVKPTSSAARIQFQKEINESFSQYQTAVNLPSQCPNPYK